MTAQCHRFDEAAFGGRKRVLFVINSLTGGGAERVMATLLANSNAWLERYDIALAILDDVPRAFEMPAWLRIFQLDCKGSILASMAALEAVVRDYDPDVALSFLTRANFALGVPMMKRRRPWVISERTSAPAHLGSAFRQATTKALMRCIYPRATRVIAVSTGVADKLVGGSAVAASKIAVIPNPVDSEALRSAAAKHDELALDQPYVIAVGRLVSVKNYQLLIRAFAKAALPCRLVIAGDGPERQAFREAGKAIGTGLSNLFTMFDPIPLVFTGPGVAALDLMMESIDEALSHPSFGMPVTVSIIDSYLDYRALIREGALMRALVFLDQTMPGLGEVRERIAASE